jgi:hypothetical protein
MPTRKKDTTGPGPHNREEIISLRNNQEITGHRNNSGTTDNNNQKTTDRNKEITGPLLHPEKTGLHRLSRNHRK